MRVLVAVPAHRVRCRVWTDETRDWSVIHEALMLALARDDWTLETLTAQTALPRQVVVAGLARLMRHRLTEVVVEKGETRFRASPVGKGLVDAGTPLPRFPNEKTRWYGLVVERFAGGCFLSREVKTISPSNLDARRRSSEATAIVALSGEEGEQSYLVTPELVADIVERGGDRRLIRIDGSSVFTNSGVFLAIPVLDGVPRLPPSASADLRQIVIRAAQAAERQVSLLPVAPVARDARPDTFDPVRCNFRPEDLVVGGSVQRRLLEDILASARKRVIIHSTFVHDERFATVQDAVRAACARGVAIDLLFGAEAEDWAAGRNVTSAKNIVSMKASSSLSDDAGTLPELLYFPAEMSVIRPEFTALSGRLKKNWMSRFFMPRETMALISPISWSVMVRLVTFSIVFIRPRPRVLSAGVGRLVTASDRR